MKDKYLIVIGDKPELSIKKHSDKIKDWKESNWLYNGITLQENYNIEDLLSNILSDKKFHPSAILDNDRWMSSDKFSEASWIKAIGQCLNLTAKGATINVYVYH